MKNSSATYEDVRAGFAPVAIDFREDSERLVVAFGGMARAREMPIFEFLKSTSCLDASKVYIRDLRRIWYHHGLPGIGENIDAIAGYLSGLIGNRHFERVVFLGSSTGAYAAILFGFLLGVDTVIAFVPKTFLNPWRRLIHFDVKTWRQMWTLIWSRTAQQQYFDLRHVLESRQTTTEFYIHYSADGRADILHAEHLRGIPHVHLLEHPMGGHMLVRRLRDTGELKGILMESVRAGSRD